VKETKIEWCDSTWNPVTGCLNDCPYCYARRIAERFALRDSAHFDRYKPEEMRGVYLWNLSDSDTGEALGLGVEFTEPYLYEKGRASAYPTRFNPAFYRYRLKQPKVWREPKNIFVCSMADLFGAWVPDEWIEEVFKVCEDAPQHNYLFLTKNPARYIQLAKNDKLPDKSNMWYGTTITTTEQIFFYSTQTNKHSFISIEPIMEDFTSLNGISPEWLIVGAETGNRKDKIIPKKEWIDNLAKECDKHGIPLFMKDSLIPIVGEENMRREFPKGLRKGE